MSEENKEITVELNESNPSQEDVMPTEEEAVAEGYTPQEVEMAKKHKLILEKQPDKEEKKESKEESKEKKEDVKKEKEKGEQKAEQEEKKEEKKQEKEEKKLDLRKKFSDPNYDFSLSEEDEYNSIKDFNPNEKAMYFARKKERRKRQEAERERNNARTRQELYEKELRVLQSELEAVRKGKVENNLRDGDEDELDKLIEEDKGTQPVKDDKKFITQEDLDRREKEAESKRQAQIEQATKLNERLKEQELEVRAYYEDYKETTDLAKEIIERPDEIFKDNPRLIAKVSAMVRQMYTTAGRALSEDQDYTAAEIFYEIGKLHPKNNGKQTQTANSEAKNAEEKNESAIDRMLANSQKKGSSASVGGGGLRKVSVYDITPDQAVRLSDKEWSKLPTSERERLLRA